MGMLHHLTGEPVTLVQAAQETDRALLRRYATDADLAYAVAANPATDQDTFRYLIARQKMPGVLILITRNPSAAPSVQDTARGAFCRFPAEVQQEVLDLLDRSQNEQTAGAVAL